MLQDTFERIQARSATKSWPILYANPYLFGVDIESDKNKEEPLFVISAQPRKTSLFNSHSRSFKGSGRSEFSPASREAQRD